MTGRLGVIALLLLMCGAPWSASAEVVELVGGEWVDGTLREATPAAVVMEVGGQIIRFPTDRVRAIYFGGPPPVPPPPRSASPAESPPLFPTAPPAPPAPPPPSAAPATSPVAPAPPQAAPPAAPASPPTAAAPEPVRPASPASDALQVVKSLRAALLGGMSFSEYQARVAGAANVVDRYLAALPSGPESDTINDVARYYSLAASAWNNQGAASRTVWLKKDDALARCHAYQEYARAMQEKGEAYYAERVRNYVVISDGVISVLWACASEKIAEAETLLEKDKKAP
jgi:hypothetical protein